MSSVNQNGRRVDLETWERRTVFEFFRHFSEPYHGVCVRVDCTEAFRFAKQERLSIFLTLLHRSLLAANKLPHFKTRIMGEEVWEYDVVHGGSAVGRDNETIGFGDYPFHESVRDFVREASIEVERVKQRSDLERHPHQNLIRYSVLPWMDFTSISHARDFRFNDSAPRITFGKITEANGRRTMPISIHVHHALTDGLHVGRLVELFERYLAAPEATGL
jgi:chloramphenicol O-acetyltransferase type A